MIKRIGLLVMLSVFIALWAFGMLFGWIFTGRDVLTDTWIDKKLESLIDQI